jgi:hypothetical protein
MEVTAGGAESPEDGDGLPPTLPLGARTSEFDPNAAAAEGTERPARPDARMVADGSGDPGEAGTEGGGGGESPHAGAPGRPLSSATLAELYFKQGLLERASEVYRQVVEEEPDNESARRRLAEIEEAGRPSRVGPTAGSSARGDDREARRRALERTIEKLEHLLVVVRGGG